MKLNGSMVVLGIIGGAAIALGAAIGYKLATDDDLRNSIVRNVRDAVGAVCKNAADMSEDVALRTAQLTKNPKVNQDWVEHQWESIGY